MKYSSIVTKRVMAAVRGAFIADAASMGTHWIYSPKEMAETVSDVSKPEFRDPPAPRFYSSEEFDGHYQFGMLSPYGEQMLFVTEHLAGGNISGEEMSKAMLQWATSFGGRPDSAMKQFIENMQKDEGQWPNCGADDDQAHIYMKVVPVVSRYAGSPDLLDKITQAIKVHQNNQKAVAFGIASARLLEAVILGAPLGEALETVEKNVGEDLEASDFKDDVLKAFARGKKGGIEEAKTLNDLLLEISHEIMEGKEDSPFYDLAGRSCGLPGSFIGPIALFYKYASSPQAFAPALRENILASGDTCSRSIFIGAVLAAVGVGSSEDATCNDGIPTDWIDKMHKPTMEKVDAALSAIVA